MLWYSSWENYFKNINIKILAVKTPSFIKQVKCNQLIESLYEAKISDTPYEDTFIKKHIVNVNIGLLEKSEHKAVESFLYTTLDEAEYYRSLYGGTIHTLQQIIMEDKLVEDNNNPLDAGTSNTHSTNLKTEIRQEGQTYYVLNIKQQTTLINGFRYIKELILQHHNYKMFQDAKTLIKNNINIYSVKTDAFTILDSDVDKVQALIIFSSERGGWRLSKTEKIFSFW